MTCRIFKRLMLPNSRLAAGVTSLRSAHAAETEDVEAVGKHRERL
jgi:hypothetical protein